MLKAKVLEYFGGPTKTAIALGVTHSAVSQWGTVIPEKQAFVIDRIAKGALKYEAKMYQKSNETAA